MSSKQIVKSSKCHECSFAGKDSDPKKFDQEVMNKFPKGFAAENHIKIKVITESGQKIERIVTNKDGKPVYFKINRCPVCGHKELVE